MSSSVKWGSNNISYTALWGGSSKIMPEKQLAQCLVYGGCTDVSCNCWGHCQVFSTWVYHLSSKPIHTGTYWLLKMNTWLALTFLIPELIQLSCINPQKVKPYDIPLNPKKLRSDAWVLWHHTDYKIAVLKMFSLLKLFLNYVLVSICCFNLWVFQVCERQVDIKGLRFIIYVKTKKFK